MLFRIVTLVALVGVVGTFLVFVARDANSRRAALEMPVRGGSIVDAMSDEPDSLLPSRYIVWAYAPIVDAALWAPLWYGDPQGLLHPGLAKEVPTTSNGGISADLKTITFHLRPGLKWSDGTPETAYDCAWTFNLYANPAFADTVGFPTTALNDPNNPIGFGSATALDATTVVLTTKHPYVGMVDGVLVDTYSTCLQQAHYTQIAPADFAKSSENAQPQVTNGPFKFKEWVHGDHITLVRNPYYYQGPDKPYLDQITFKFITDPARMLAALQSHLVDVSWNLNFTELDSLRAISGYTTSFDTYASGVEYLQFNLQDPILRDLAVRQALTMSFDISGLPQLLYKGGAQLTCDDSIGTFAHEPSLVPCYHFDPHAAAQLLDADGWTMGADGYRHKNGQTLALSYITGAVPWRKQTQALAQAEWQAVGIKVDLQNPREFQSLMCAGRFQIGEVGLSYSYDPDDRYFFASDQTCDKGGINWMHYANTEVDVQEQIQETTADFSDRKAAFHIIHADVLRDLPVMYLYSIRPISCHISKLHNYNPIAKQGTGANVWNVWNWYLSATP